jgi:hypothetical protein
VLEKILAVILKPAKNPDLKDVILSEAKNLLFFFLFKKTLKNEILHYVQDDGKVNLQEFCKHFHFLLRLFVKIHIVILQPAKNLLFFFSSQKSKEEILRTYVLRMTDKGKLVKILEHSQFPLDR